MHALRQAQTIDQQNTIAIYTTHHDTSYQGLPRVQN